MMRPSSFCTLLALFLLPLRLLADGLDQLISDYIADAPNGYHSAFAKHGMAGSANGEEILPFAGESRNGKARYVASFKLAVIDASGRRPLHNTFQQLRGRLSALLPAWEKQTESTFFYGSDTFTRSQDDGVTRVVLALENLDGADTVHLQIEYTGPGTAEVAQLPTTAPATADDAPAPPATATPAWSTAEGQQVLLDLLRAADSEFRDLRIPTDDPDRFRLPASVLNPAAAEPFLLLHSTSPMRYELEIFFAPKYGFAPYNLPLPEIENLLRAEGWTIQQDNRRWSALPPQGRAKRLVKRQHNGREYFVLEVVKEAWRARVEAHPQLVDVDCLTGDCVDGYARIRYLDTEAPFWYEGHFREARPEGWGRQFMRHSDPAENPLPAYIGWFKDGVRHGPGISYQFSGADTLDSIRTEDTYFTAADEVMLLPYLFQEYEAGELVMEIEKYWLHHQPPGQGDGFVIKTPFATRFGRPLSGDCENGDGILELPGLGTYAGHFVDGLAQGYGELSLPNGEIKAFELHAGIPAYTKTLVLPAGVSRVAAAKRGAFQLAVNDCLQGNCLNGEGIALMGSADHFSIGQYDYEGLYEGGFKNGRFHGKGAMRPFVGQTAPPITISGRFENGRREGPFLKRTGEAEEETLYYQDDVRYTESGQLYSAFLVEDLERRREERAKLLAEKIEKERLRLAAIDRRNEEIRKRNEARQRAATQRKAPRRNVLYTATFTGRSHRIPANSAFGLIIEDLDGKSSQPVIVEYIGGYNGDIGQYRFSMRGGVLNAFIGDATADPDKPRLLDITLLDHISPSANIYYVVHCAQSSRYRIIAYQ
ncbi:hypothetical protein [Actomonas aquatica]|uniref:Uncharacterized protein n=1 Tax=Actomonas aquatica TaxID=2866162 RepID=A0ABZ1C7Z3_9BACT|nr:hypothetical protein [Opitutus sp. WL0086]WRQ86415.1 hypothetical protein K1X11_016490 [Opitutus sp. WL0086]